MFFRGERSLESLILCLLGCRFSEHSAGLDPPFAYHRAQCSPLLARHPPFETPIPLTLFFALQLLVLAHVGNLVSIDVFSSCPLWVKWAVRLSAGMAGTCTHYYIFLLCQQRGPPDFFRKTYHTLRTHAFFLIHPDSGVYPRWPQRQNGFCFSTLSAIWAFWQFTLICPFRFVCVFVLFCPWFWTILTSKLSHSHSFVFCVEPFAPGHILSLQRENY